LNGFIVKHDLAFSFAN